MLLSRTKASLTTLPFCFGRMYAWKIVPVAPLLPALVWYYAVKQNNCFSLACTLFLSLFARARSHHLV